MFSNIFMYKLRFYVAESRTQNRESLIAEIDSLNASDPENPITHVINAAGVTGSSILLNLFEDLKLDSSCL